MSKSVSMKFVSVLFVLAFVVSCAPGGSGGPTPTPLPPVVSYEKAVFIVERGSIVEEKRLVGEIVPARQEELFFRTSGFVTRVSAKQGDLIAKGTLLAEMQVDDLLNQLQQARIDLEVAEANLAKDKAQRSYEIEKTKADVVIQQKLVELATINFERSFGEQRQLAQIQLDIAIQNFRLAEASLKLVSEDANLYTEQAVKRSQLSVERLEGLLAERQIVAPFDCVVLRSSMRPGQQVEAFSIAFVVGDPAELVIRSPLEYETSSLLTKTTEVNLFIDANSTEPHPVEFLPNFLPIRSEENQAVVQRSSSNDYIFFNLPQDIPQVDLPVGQSVYLTVILGRKDNVLLLPPSAVREYKGLMFVIVQDGEKRRRVEINKVGLRAADKWEIDADLQEGEKVQGP
jgi:multidrug efflux pump subunit AcrA (membrane-fusion protein)